MECEQPISLEERVRRKERELGAVIEISRIIGQALPLREMLNRIAAEVARLLDFPFCAILLSDPQDDLLTIEGAYGLDPEYIKQANAQRSVHIDDMVGLPSIEAYHSAKAVTWEDVHVARDFAFLREAVQLQGYRAMAAVPLIGPGGPLGTLTCYQTSIYHFSETELSLLMTIANHAAIAIHNKYLLDELNTNINRLTELNQILEHQRETLMQSEAIHRRFTELVLEERGLSVIVETLASLLDRGVCLYDQQLNPLAEATASGSKAPKPVSLDPELLKNGLLTNLLPQPSALIQLAAGPAISAPALLAPLVARRKVLGYLVVPNKPELSGELEWRAIEHAATVCALELVKQRNALEVERRMRSSFIGDLLAGRFVTDKEIQRRAAYLGYELKGNYRVLGVDIDLFRRYVEQRQLSESQVEDLKQRLVDLIEQTSHQIQPQAIVAAQGDRAVILWPSFTKTSKTSERVADFASQLMAKVRQIFPNMTISVGVSTVVSTPAEFSRAHQEALDALTIARSFGRREARVNFDDLGIYSLLLRHTSPDELLRFAHRRLDPLVRREKRRPADLLKTLEIALKEGLSPQKTAALLFVHPNTIKHRLKQVRELTGIDFSDSKQLLELQLALLVRRMADDTFDTALTPAP